MTPENDSDRAGLSHMSTESPIVEEYYDDWAEKYDETLADWNYRAPEEAAAILREHLGPGAEILDAGCGTGLTGLATSRAGFTVIDGNDLSSKSLDEARKLNVYRTLEQVDMQKLPLPVESDAYDGLECIGVLTYLPDSEPLLRELCRVVRPGGVVVLTQRDDIFEERDFGSVLRTLESEGLWKILEVSEPRPYLPGNDEFADRIRVHFITCRVG